MTPIRKSARIFGLVRSIRKMVSDDGGANAQEVARINLELSSGCHNTRVNRSPEDSISCFRYLPKLSTDGPIPRMRLLTSGNYRWSIVELPRDEFNEKKRERHVTDPHLFPAPLSRRTEYSSRNSMPPP